MLTLIDALLSEYTWPGWHDRRGRFRGPDEYIIHRLSLARCFALFAAIQPRYNVEPKGPTYVQRAMIRAKRAAERTGSS